MLDEMRKNLQPLANNPTKTATLASESIPKGMNSNRDIAYFLSFCIEQYKNAKELTGCEAMPRLADTGALDYLNEHYEILHTQSWQWILEDIDDYIKLETNNSPCNSITEASKE